MRDHRQDMTDAEREAGERELREVRFSQAGAFVPSKSAAAKARDRKSRKAAAASRRKNRA